VRRYALSEDAEFDLDEIVAFISDDSPSAAQRVLVELDAAMTTLSEMSRMGHVRRDVAEDDVRFWSVHTYLIVYRAEVTPIQILRIVSGYRDLADVLR
jgi:plasmid stabilization system protein ParE